MEYFTIWVWYGQGNNFAANCAYQSIPCNLNKKAKTFDDFSEYTWVKKIL